MKKIIILLLFTFLLSSGLFAAEAGTGFSRFEQAGQGTRPVLRSWKL